MPLEIGFNSGWRPDLSENLGGHLIKATNVFPSENGYRPVRSFEAVTDALEGTPLGGLSIRDAAGVARFYVATAENIFVNVGAAWVSVSPSTDFFSTPSTEVFDFTRYGIGTIATNFNDPVHTLVEGTDTQFRQLIDITDADNYLDGVVPGGGDPDDSDFFGPKARWAAEVNNHLVLGYTNDNQSGVSPERVAWSRLGDPSKFVPNVDFLANFNDLRGGGAVQQVISSGEYGVVFQETSVSRMDPGNPVQGFDITTVDQARGALMSGGVIAHGRRVGYIAEDGFYLFDGKGSEPIGIGSVDRTFLRQYNNANKRLVRGIVDKLNKAFVWALPLNSADGRVTRLFSWSWAFKRWSEIEVEVNFPVSAEVGGSAIDDSEFASTLVDDLTTTSVDSTEFAAQTLQLGAFDSSNRFAFPTGQALAVLLETSDTVAVAGKRSIVNSVRARFDGDKGGVSMQVGGSQTPGNQAAVFAPPVPVNLNGESPTRVNARYHRFRTLAGFGHNVREFNGVEVPDEAIAPVGVR